jgi:hypothetical protein
MDMHATSGPRARTAYGAIDQQLHADVRELARRIAAAHRQLQGSLQSPVVTTMPYWVDRLAHHAGHPGSGPSARETVDLSPRNVPSAPSVLPRRPRDVVAEWALLDHIYACAVRLRRCIDRHPNQPTEGGDANRHPLVPILDGITSSIFEDSLAPSRCGHERGYPDE